jgi:8-oxo-dGTP diphosphatase
MDNDDLYFLGVKALIRNNEGEVLLMKIGKREFGYQGQLHWDIPGGRVERGETPMQTLQREISEETGITNLGDIRALKMVVSNLRVPLDTDASKEYGLILSVYTCKIDPGMHIQLSDEHTEFSWFSPAEAAKLLGFKYPKELTELVRNV